ncbi:CPXCG motif-containing cysteine-rich protein [Thalassotalea euphylliae]|uniref:CPXCG motif-containing cysteine-rich protein n=1 Tax=Thalassotalea euphylliae TaxID=1655234 RepID=A0A3E0TQP6_9GAMM|nr:CPXCG motif-containing cysteine-rich protein [Thalassotalea euphylliae]REL26773.1 CPXCG motif-containing cysteine-rich protein [Thalassotalea euphylliae]
MLEDLQQQRIECPHCGHHLHVTLDPSAGDQNYYDECPACCSEIHFVMHIDEIGQKIELHVDADDEQVF